jgi:hypothetical protein
MADQNDNHRRKMIRSANQAQEVMNYRPPAYFAMIRRTMVGLVLIAVFSIAYVGFWFYAATGLRSSLGDWATQARQSGWVVSYTRSVLSGFPLDMRLTVRNPEFASATTNSNWAWKGQKIVIQKRPWNLRKFTIEFPNRHELKLQENDRQATYKGISEDLEVQFKSGRRWPTELILRIRGLDLKNSKNARLSAGEVIIEGTYDPTVLDDIKSSSVTLKIDAQNLIFPASIKLPMGPRVAKLSLESTVMGGIEPGTLGKSLVKWRDAGGTVEIPKFSMAYGPLRLVRSDGTVALDGNLQPVGAFTAKVTGFFELLDSLRLIGWIKSKDSVTAKVTMSAFFKKDETGGPPSLNLSISAQDGKIFAGQHKLADMPSVNWGLKVAPK